jgi:rare lipoprotein A
MRGLNVASLVVAVAAIISFCCQNAFAECGIASHYSEGSVTATGERYNHLGISAAHKTLPFGSIVRVTHQRTGRSIQVRINDRGPFVHGRIIDLSTGAKRALGMDGLAPVCVNVVSYGSGRHHGGRVIVAHHGHRHFARHHSGTRYASRHHRGHHRYASRASHHRVRSTARASGNDNS